jgi:protein-S-isoprenylcysteine O-methyltransferase Ste14
VSFPAWIAAIVLFLQLPIPLYWFVVHPFRAFWKRHTRGVYVTGLACSWLPVTIAIAAFHGRLFRRGWPSPAEITIGVALIAFEVWIFWRVAHDLGAARLIGRKELEGTGEIQFRGMYSRIRHPRYAGSFLALIGACFLAGTRTTWVLTALWLALMCVAIAMEEKEMRARFGARYLEYCEKVPRFLPKLPR